MSATALPLPHLVILQESLQMGESFVFCCTLLRLVVYIEMGPLYEHTARLSDGTVLEGLKVTPPRQFVAAGDRKEV